MPFNGPSYEPSPDLPDGLSYCVACGTVMVYHSSRDCPSCTLAERLEDIEERLDRAERDIDIIDGGL